MNILNVWNFFQDELKYHVHYLGEQFARKGHKVYFLSTDKINKAWRPYLKLQHCQAGVEQYSAYKVFRLRSREFFDKQLPADRSGLKACFKEANPDVVHFLGIGNFLTWYTLRYISRQNKRMVVVANDHSNPTMRKESLIARVYHRLNRDLYKKWEKKFLKIIVPNKATYQFLQEKYQIPDAQMMIIPLGYDATHFKILENGRNNETERLVIGFAGKINPEKRVATLVEAIGKSKYKSQIDCLIAGFKEEADTEAAVLKTRAASVGVQLVTKPLLDKTQLRDFYNFIDVAVFPGSISITTIEANGCGTPILLYRSIPGLEDRVENGRGVLFDTVEELTAQIDQYFEQKQAGQINHTEISQNTYPYSWDHIADRYLDVYTSLLEKTTTE